ncbi:protein MULTIPOLAR SPINDLE 1 isoform X2 [Gossypium raimondii]|uniref:protein MULTIPOLAR SPINDLE 1 isoform X2 n=1 Tax=Gossypium raimondii TaxID=29730 RepID=UPI00063B06F1|nr:protein MULTIPOLAR SPINDLE 1 isoform X2 [Gossypium raimondii]
MSSSEHEAPSAATNTLKEEPLKLAVAISLLRSKFLQRHPPPPSLSDDALKWKRKAKERKQEILKLKDDLKEAEEASQCDIFPQTASCKCYFFDNLGKLSPNRLGDGSDRRFHDVLRRRFLRQVRLRERRRTCRSSQKRRAFAALKNLLSMGKNLESVEGVVSRLIMCLVRQMSSPSRRDEARKSDTNSQLHIQHLLRKLGCQSYIGQRIILSISQRISVLAESLLFSDPFDETFPAMHECMFVMIQLIEFLVSDYLLTWSTNEDFENSVFEEWVTSLLQARKSVEVLESRNGLYVQYMDRVVGELSKLVGQSPALLKLNSGIFDALLS